MPLAIVRSWKCLSAIVTRKRALPVNGVNMAPEIFLESKSLCIVTAGDVAFESMFVYLYVLALSNVNNVSLVWICLAHLRSQRRENSFWQESQISCRCFPRVFRDVRLRVALRMSSGTGGSGEKWTNCPKSTEGCVPIFCWTPGCKGLWEEGPSRLDEISWSESGPIPRRSLFVRVICFCAGLEWPRDNSEETSCELLR